MCSVIGAVIQKPSDTQLSTLKQVFLESKVRGLHATGISYLKDNKIITEKLPVPADEFPFNFLNYINEDGNLYLIGHCRYSTSDLEYNQPIHNEMISIVHNGVISQESPERWKELYNIDCTTKNDSELILHTDDPLDKFPNMSMSVCELYKNKILRVYRNGKRPLYITELNNGYIITSTKDIPKRANVNGITKEVENSSYITIHQNLLKNIQSKQNKLKDYQYV